MASVRAPPCILVTGSDEARIQLGVMPPLSKATASFRLKSELCGQNSGMESTVHPSRIRDDSSRRARSSSGPNDNPAGAVASIFDRNTTFVLRFSVNCRNPWTRLERSGLESTVSRRRLTIVCSSPPTYAAIPLNSRIKVSEKPFLYAGVTVAGGLHFVSKKSLSLSANFRPSLAPSRPSISANDDRTQLRFNATTSAPHSPRYSLHSGRNRITCRYTSSCATRHKIY